MRVVFWSPQRNSGTTSNLLLTACMLSEKYAYRTVLIPTLYGNEDFKHYFSRGKTNAVRETCVYEDGSEALLRAAREGSLTSRHIGKAVKTLKKGSLFYCDGFLSEKMQYGRTEIENLQSRMIDEINHMADYVFIDCGCGKDEWTMRQIRLADLIVVNLTQTQKSLNHFFCDSSEISEKQIYFIHSYQKDSSFDKKKIQRMCRMEPRKLCVVPYNPEFEAACLNGKLDRYLKLDGWPEKNVMRKYFFEEADHNTEVMLDFLNGQKRENKSR